MFDCMELIWFRDQTEACVLFSEFVASPGKDNLVVIMGQGHVVGAWKPMRY